MILNNSIIIYSSNKELVLENNYLKTLYPKLPAYSETRYLQYLRGRLAIHKALTKIGVPLSSNIASGVLGEPKTPEGVKCSISHSDPYSVCFLTTCPVIKHVGIDLQKKGSFKLPKKWIKNEQDFTPGADLLTVLSLKESAFKIFSVLYESKFTYNFIISKELAPGMFLSQFSLDNDKAHSYTKSEVVYSFVISRKNYLLSLSIQYDNKK